MADIQSQLPVKITDGVNTAGITGSSAFKVDLSATGVNATAIKVDGSTVTQPVSGTITNVPSGTQTVVGTITAAQATAASLNATVVGTLTHNGSAPGTNAVAILPAIATTAAPTYATGSVVSLSTDLAGNLRVTSSASTQTVVQATAGNLNATVVGTVTATQATATNLKAQITGAGTAGAADAGVVSVQGIAGGTSIPIALGEVTLGIVTFQGTSTALASASTATISYTVTVAKTLFLKQIFASSSGAPCKVIVDYGAGPTIVAVGFYSSARPFLAITFAQPVSIAASTVVNVKIQNNAGVAQDVYASIFGHEQ